MKAITDPAADEATRSDESLHDWRKRSKVLWYQLQVLENTWPGEICPFAEQVHQLTDWLGEDHDLAVLSGLIGANGATGLPEQERDRLLDTIRRRRCDLQQDAFELGRRIYAEKTHAFVRRIGQYWHAWSHAQIESCPAGSSPTQAEPAAIA